MNELDILRTVKSERKPNMGGRPDYRVADLRRALGVEESREGYLSDSLVSDLLLDKQRADDNRILRYISGPGKQQARVRNEVEQVLGLPGLFSCSSRAEVVALIEMTDRVEYRSASFALCNGPPEEDFGLTDAEQNTIADLAKKISFRDQPVFYWSTPFNSGASTIVRNLWPALNEHGSCSMVAVLRPSNFALPFEAELAALANFLEMRGHRVESKRLLADAISAEGMLVVVLSSFALDSTLDSNSMRALAKEFLARHNQWTGASNMLFVGESEWLTKRGIVDAVSQSGKLKTQLRISGKNRFLQFRSQWQRFADLREQVLSEESGSRMRRAATYFRVQNKEDAWPISVKLRALFASNTRTSAYFDPTQGFKRLAGPRFDEFEDLKSYHQDVADYVGYVRYLDMVAEESRRKKNYYYLLQYISTAKHWLTEEALDKLIDKVEGARQNRRNLVTEKGRLRSLHPIVTEKAKVVAGVKRSDYFASIAVKAAVQDDWIESDPFTRSLAHYRIAKRLKENENNKGLLDREFPYEPHWGRSRIFFLAETIRHLVRSCETYSKPPNGVYENLAFPLAPNRIDNGTDPVQVINYCYDVLYHRELHGNANGVNGRALAKRYGAYQLAVELLELLSDNYEMGVPHPALEKSRRTEFVRECAFALLDVGELERARSFFDKINQEVTEKGQLIEEINLALDLALVDSALNQLDDVEKNLAKARAKVQELHSELIAKNVGHEQFKQVRKLFRRLLSRDAHLAFLKGENDAALDLLDQIDNEKRWEHAKARDGYDRRTLVPSFGRLEAEQTHLLIAALHHRAQASGNEAETKDFAVALEKCLEAMLFAQSEGHHHQAMGYRIVLARCFRRMGRFTAAETVLDAVHYDLLRYGCSERTFLAFLNEAGRVLLALGDPIRAYATYLRPCFSRAKARGFYREAEQAAAQAQHALERIRKSFLDCVAKEDSVGTSWTARLEEAVSKHHELISEADGIFSGGPFEKDPLFAYAIADAEGLITELSSIDNIEGHIQFFRGGGS
jgi:hypothetical protein